MRRGSGRMSTEHTDSALTEVQYPYCTFTVHFISAFTGPMREGLTDRQTDR